MRFLRLAAVLLLGGAASAQTAHHKAAAAPAPALTVEQMLAAANAERPLLKAIYQAPTDQSIADKHPRSRIGAMVLAAKQYQFHPAVGGPAVLAALPRTSAEVEALLQFCAADPDLAGLDRYFYGAALESVTHHPQSLPAVMQAASVLHAKEFPDAAPTSDWYCSELAKVRNTLPQLYDRVAQDAPVEDQAYLKQCGGGS